jgi:hypothetical protein
MKKRNKHISSSLEDFLKEGGVLEETRAVALKETLAWQVQQAMERDKISKVEMALQTLTRAAHAIGRDLRIELVLGSENGAVERDWSGYLG